MEYLVFVLSLVTVLFALVSRKFNRSLISAPMLFTAIGMVIALTTTQMLEQESAFELLEVVAELTLIVVLFIDASRIRLPLLIKDYSIPLRLLGIGLPLTVALGALIAWFVFPGLSIWEAAILAAILAPTDAALGQAVVSSEKVPQKIRQSLNVESGLNDGIVLPLVILFAAMASSAPSDSEQSLVLYWLKQVTLGPMVGIAVGFLGGHALEISKSRGWLSEEFQELSGVGLALLAWSAAGLIGGNGFIAAFTAGVAISCHADQIGESLREFGEAEGQWLSLATFLLFGVVSTGPLMDAFQWEYVAYAIASLTVIRILPVAVSLLGSKLHWPTYLFVGWFGPRGLASLLFALLIVNQFEIASANLIFNVSVLTVFCSIIAHGASAIPGTLWYSRTLDKVCNKESVERKPALQHRPKFMRKSTT